MLVLHLCLEHSPGFQRMTAEGVDKVDDSIRWIASSERPSIDEFVEEIGVVVLCVLASG